MFDELTIHIGAIREGSIKGGSPRYVPRSDDALNIPRPISVKDVINSLWDRMKGNTPLGVVDVLFL